MKLFCIYIFFPTHPLEDIWIWKKKSCAILKIWKNLQKSLLSSTKMWLIIRNIWRGFEKSGPFHGEYLIYDIFSPSDQDQDED